MTTESRPVYYGNTTQRNAHDQASDASGDLFWDYDDEILYVWDGSAWVEAGGGGWKLGNLIVVSSSGDGDYTTIAAAIAAASSGDTILVDEGSYACNGETLPTGVDLIGMGVITTTLSTTTSATCLTLNGTNYVHNIMIQNFYASGSITQALQVSGASVRCYNVRSVAFNSGGGGCRGVLVDSGTQPIMMWSEAQGTVSGGGTGYGLYVNSGDAKLYFGNYVGTDYGVYLNTPSAAVDFGMPACRAISGTDMYRSGGTAPVGWYFNTEGALTGFNELSSIPDEITAASGGVAASVSTVNTEVTTNGDSDLDNVTLANGRSGQIKHIYCVAEGNVADTWKITPANMVGGTQITFSGVGEGCTLVYADSEGWCVVANNGGTIT